MPPNEEYNKKIREICEASPCSCGTILKFKTDLYYLREYIMKFSEHLPDLPFTTKIWFALTGQTEYVKCKKCGNDIPHDRKCRPLTGYDSYYCSQKCSQSSDDHKHHLQKICQAKYGVNHPSQCTEIRKRISKGHLNRSKSAITESNEKRANTNMERYGVKAPSQIPEIAESIGLAQENRSETDKLKTIASRKKTKLEKYGDENYVNYKKAKATFDMHCKNDPTFKQNIDNKIKKTLMEKYGVDCALKIKKCKDSVRKSRCGRKYDDVILVNELVEPMFSRDFYIDHFSESLHWKCRKCGNEFKQKISEHQPFMARCEKCFPLLGATSSSEKELTDFLKNICNAEMLENRRDIIAPREIDIYIPSRKLAIEFDGLYWHSENTGTPNNYHLSKTEDCEKVGIRLVHVFEDEWLFKRRIVESRLADMLGYYGKTIFARQCTVIPITTHDANEFLRENHIQGKCFSKIQIGLCFEGELVSLMTFGKCRFDRKHEWELLRFCNKLNYHIPGAAGKLLKYFEKTYSPKSLISYADRRWSQGNLYYKLGFSLSHVSKPDYWYWSHKTDTKILESRIKYQKHKLPKLLQQFDPAKSEKENMFANGYYRIFDCGNYVFEKTY